MAHHSRKLAHVFGQWVLFGQSRFVAALLMLCGNSVCLHIAITVCIGMLTRRRWSLLDQGIHLLDSGICSFDSVFSACYLMFLAASYTIIFLGHPSWKFGLRSYSPFSARIVLMLLVFQHLASSILPHATLSMSSSHSSAALCYSLFEYRPIVWFYSATCSPLPQRVAFPAEEGRCYS